MSSIVFDSILSGLLRSPQPPRSRYISIYRNTAVGAASEAMEGRSRDFDEEVGGNGFVLFFPTLVVSWPERSKGDETAILQ